MPDPKKNLSIFSFNSGQRNLFRYIALFFGPVIIVAFILEGMIVNLPSSYKITGDYLNSEKENINTVVFGSSQIKNSVNPEFLEQEAINLSSSAQHHNTDFKILKDIRSRLPNLKTVVFEVSYSHFEIPHNSKYYWKNSLFLKYYKVNTFDRPTNISDKLLYVSHPGFFTELLIDYYIRDSVPYAYNKWGFDNNYFEGKFKKLNYDAKLIDNSFVKINRREDPKTFDYNLQYFIDILEYCNKEQLNVVIVSPPTYTNYHTKRNTNILHRRDSVLEVLDNNYENVFLLISEKDPDFLITHFRNENHLNPIGAERFTKKIDSIISTFK
jgi:hypothetical protein